MTLRRRLHHLLDADHPASRLAHRVRSSLVLLILLNVVAVVLETVPAVNHAAPGLFHGFELVSVTIFGLEYLLRLWSIAEDRRYAGPFGRWRWAVSSSGLIDLLAVLPSLLPTVSLDLRSLRLLRLLRIIRLGKLGRYSIAAQTLHSVLRNKAADLISLLGMLLVLLLLTSTVMYWLEHDAQPQLFSSIPATMWWGIVTLSTIGYGDMSPVTDAGRAFGGVVAIVGIGMFALPAGLLGAAFVDELARRRAQHPSQQGEAGAAERCPHCGKPR